MTKSNKREAFLISQVHFRLNYVLLQSLRNPINAYLQLQSLGQIWLCFFLVRLDHCVSLFACASSHPLSIALFLPNVACTIIIIITQIMQKDPVLAYSYHLLLH